MRHRIGRRWVGTPWAVAGVALSLLGCGSRSPSASAVPVVTRAAEPAPRGAGVTYSEVSLCDDAETTSTTNEASEKAKRSGCCVVRRAPIRLDRIELARDVSLQLGYAQTDCDESHALPTDFAREPSLNPSEQLRPGGQVLGLDF